MRLKLLKVVTILLGLAGSSNGRPQQLDVSENLQPKVENDNAEGWRPVQPETKIAQESIPAGKDLPQIVEGNSRYTEEGRASRGKSYVRNNPFYEGHIPVSGYQNTSDRNREQLDIEASKSKLIKPLDALGSTTHRQNNKVLITSRNGSDVKISSSYKIRRNKGRGPSIRITDLEKNETLNRTGGDRRIFHSMIGEISTNNMKSNLSVDVVQTPGNTVPILNAERYIHAIPPRNRISSHYRGQMKTSPILLNNLSNVGSLSSLNLSTSFYESRLSGNESQTRMIHSEKVRPPITLHSPSISNGYEPVHVNKEKVMNFVKIVPSYSNSKNYTNKTTLSQSSIHNLHEIHDQISEPDSYNSKIKVKSSQSDPNGIVIGLQRQANQTSKHQFDSKNSTNKLIRINPPVNGIIKNDTRKAGNHKNNTKILKVDSKHKQDSSQSILDLKLKNWPNENLQNIEDLFNYEKYTSFHNTDESLEAQETAGDSPSHGNSANLHKGAKKPDKTPGPKPSILIFDHFPLPVEPVKNGQAGVTVHNNPESYVNLEQSTEEAVHWEQIHPLTFNNDDFPVADTNVAESNAFNPIPEGLQPNRPLNPYRDQAPSTNYYGYVDESISGTKPPSQIVQNHHDDPDQGQEYYQSQYDQPVFGNPNSESNLDQVDVTRPPSQTNESDNKYDGNTNGPVYGPELSKRPYFNPTSVVSQNTVVHILNAGKKRPNVTVTKMKVVPDRSDSPLNPDEHSTDSKNSSSSTPNVHIMFTTQEDQGEESGPQYELMANPKAPEVTYDDSANCPTIKIDSYTRINNTVQSKEGCTDLNIIISSHVLNTNIFGTENHGSEIKVPSEKYPGDGQTQPSYATSDGGYPTSGGNYGAFPTGSGQNTGGLTPSDFQDYPISGGQNTQDFLQDGQFGQQSPGSSTFELFQQTEINVGTQNDAPGTGDALDLGVPNDPASAGDALGDIPGSPEAGEPDAGLGVEGDPAISGIPGVSNDPVNPAELADDPGSAGVVGDPAAGGGTPAFPPLNGIQGPFADEGPQGIAADTPVSPGTGGSSGIQFPSLSNPLSGVSNPLSGISNPLSGSSGNPLSQLGGDSGSQGSILGDDDDDDDDDDDEDMLDLMPFSIMESLTSMLPYVTLLNPLNYGFLSFAISPIAVAVAGIFGLAAAVVPFALRGAFSFGRAADRVTVRLRPSLEEVVKRSIHQYENWNEWKSKRKKRKR